MENKTPNGLSRWAADNGTTVEEIKILTKADGLDWDNLLAPLTRTNEPVATGTATALSGMMERSRGGSIKATFGLIAEITGTTALEISNAISRRKDGAYENCVEPGADKGMENVLFNCSRLNVLLADIRGETIDAPAPAPDTKQNDEANPGPPVNTPKPVPAKSAQKAPARKKTKYTVGKAVLSELLENEKGIGPVREVRAFLLSLPEYKPQDVALMTDDEVLSIFSRNYKSIQFDKGTLVISQNDYLGLIDLLGAAETYFVPKPETKPIE